MPFHSLCTWSRTAENGVVGDYVYVYYFLVIVAAISSGVAVILQTRAARAEDDAAGVDAGLLLRLVRNPTYLIALVLVAVGFVAAAAALRGLPVYVVQAGRASSLGVTAIVATWALGVRLRRSDVAMLLLMGVGLVLLAGTSPPTSTAEPAPSTGWWLLLASAVLVVTAVLALRAHASGAILGLLAGVAFGLLAVNVRVVLSQSPGALLTEPAVLALLVGPLGMHLAAVALQRSQAVSVAAILVASETLVGSGIGLLIGGALPQGGAAIAAAVAVLLIVIAASVLARFGAPLTDAERESLAAP